MTTTISVTEVTKAKFDDLRPEGAASADEFLAVLLDYYEDGVEPDCGDGLPAEVREQLNRIEAATCDSADTAQLEASERRATAEEVAEVLRE